MVEGEYAGKYELDASYRFTDVEADVVLDEIYPSMVEKAEETFSDAALRCYDEIHD